MAEWPRRRAVFGYPHGVGAIGLTHYTAGQRSAYAAKLSTLTRQDAVAMRWEHASLNSGLHADEPARAPIVGR